MITNIKLQNFKCFSEQNLSFKALTLLSGMNSTGKSSILQSLLLLRQSFQQTGLVLNGDLVCIGTAQDALFEGAEEDVIGFQITWGNGMEGTWEFTYQDPGALKLDQSSDEVGSRVYESNLFGDKFHYLHNSDIAHFLSMRDKRVYEGLRHPSANSSRLIDQVEAWMGEFSPGIRINTPEQYSYGLSNSYRAKNVGSGVSYALPIVVALLTSEPGTLLLLENPETHLHPKGQAKIGELLALAASIGIQVVLETHSDHITNGIRLSVHGGKLDPNDVQLHYFQRKQVVSPHMDDKGRIDNWPDGFFDEWDKSLEVLIS